MMLTAIRDPDPVIFLEAGALYGTKGEVPDGEYTVPFGKARIAREGTDVTLIGYGRQVQSAAESGGTLDKEDGIAAEVIDLRSIRPFDERHDRRIGARKRTGRSSCRSSGAGSAWPARLRRSSRSRRSTISMRRSSGSAARKCRRRTRAISKSAAFPSEQQVIDAVRTGRCIERIRHGDGDHAQDGRCHGGGNASALAEATSATRSTRAIRSPKSRQTRSRSKSKRPKAAS